MSEGYETKLLQETRDGWVTKKVRSISLQPVKLCRIQIISSCHWMMWISLQRLLWNLHRTETLSKPNCSLKAVQIAVQIAASLERKDMINDHYFFSHYLYFSHEGHSHTSPKTWIQTGVQHLLLKTCKTILHLSVGGQAMTWLFWLTTITTW